MDIVDLNPSTSNAVMVDPPPPPLFLWAAIFVYVLQAVVCTETLQILLG